jgi:hypothetical protein
LAYEALESWVLEANDLDLDDWMIGAGEWFHPCGDDESEFVPHLNFIVPLVAVSGSPEAEICKTDELKNWYSEYELYWLRVKWRTVLENHYQIRINQSVNINYQYVSGTKQKMHRLRYYCRTFPGWGSIARYTRWFGFLSTRNWCFYCLIFECREKPFSRVICVICGRVMKLDDVFIPILDDS